MKSIGTRGWFWLITPILLLAFSQTVGAADLPSLQLSSNPGFVLVGQRVIVNVLVKNAPLIYGAESHLIFDPNMLEVVDADLQQTGVQISPGNFLDSAHSFALLHQVNNETGKVDYALTLINPAPAVQGDGLLARITFVAKAQGQTTLLIVYGMFGTQTGETIAPELSSMDILINNEISTPTRTPPSMTQTFTSTAAQDGWILESGETSDKGGTMDSSATTFNLGDDKTRKQYRSILSFSTGATLPNNAHITKVTLKIKKSAITGGGNPVNTFQGFMIDIKNGVFGTAALQTGDFQAAGSESYGPFKPDPVSNWYSIDLTAGKEYINIGSGLTQIRLRFKLDDNNNALANYLSLFSGNASAGSRPQLIIAYIVP